MALSLVLLLSLYLGNSSIIGHSKISSITLEKFKMDSSKALSLIETIEISDQDRIAKLVKAIDKPKNQKLEMDLDILIIYDRNYIITIHYKNGSELKLAVTFSSNPSQGNYVPSKIRIGDSFFDDSNVFLLSQDDVDLFSSIIN